MRALCILAVGLFAVGCRDASRFSSRGDRFEGAVVRGNFVRSGVDASTSMCLTLDTEHLQDAPGFVSTSDGRFDRAPLRPIPQLWHDPLSTFNFGDGRERNLLYAATPKNETGDAFIVISLMQNGSLEARILRSAPTAASDAGTEPPLFGVFSLERRDGPCTP